MNDIWANILQLIKYHNEGILTTDHSKTVTTSGLYSAAGGGNETNAGGNFSFAFGDKVKTNNNNSVIFGSNGSLTKDLQNNITGLFGIADGTAASDSPIFEVQKLENEYGIMINNVNICQTINSNKANIETLTNNFNIQNNNILNINNQLKEIENNFNNYIPVTSIITTDAVSPEDNTIYSSKWVSEKFNSLLANKAQVDTKITTLENTISQLQARIEALEPNTDFNI